MNTTAPLSVVLTLLAACPAACETLQQRIDAAEEATLAAPPGPNAGATWATPPRVVRVTGRHEITEPIRLPHAIRLVFDGAMIDGSRLAEDEFVFDGVCHRGAIEGSLAIVNAPNGVRTTKNLAGGMFTIAGVHFAGVRGTAIDLDSRSAVVTIDRCVFDRCGRVLHNRRCDDVSLDRCFVTASGYDRSPIVTEHGRLLIKGGAYTPPREVVDDPDRAWVEIRGTDQGKETMFVADHARFGGEFAGMPVVNNLKPGRTKYTASPGTTIVLTALNANHAAKGEPTAGLVRLDAVPNLIVIRDCYGMVRPGPLIDFGPRFDPRMLERYSARGINNRLQIDVGRHPTITPGEELPSVLRPYAVNQQLRAKAAMRR